MQAIYLDMDGTINQFYSYPNWLPLLRAENIEPYEKCAPIHRINELNSILCEFASLGVTIGVISWGAMDCSNAYTRATKKAKVAWCKRYLTCISEYHVVKYGTPKHVTAKIKDSILIDDNADVRKAWKNGATIDASNSEEMMEKLRGLLDIMKAA